MEDSSEDESAIFITQSQRSENAAAVEGINALTFGGSFLNDQEYFSLYFVIVYRTAKI